MEELFNLGISEKTMNNILDINPYSKQISKDEILHKIQLLKSIDCSNREILNIISSNPLYLNQTNDKFNLYEGEPKNNKIKVLSLGRDHLL